MTLSPKEEKADEQILKSLNYKILIPTNVQKFFKSCVAQFVEE